jgi:hypothetical protein
MTDRDRSAVYAAELAAFDGTDLERVLPMGAALDAARALIGTQWWPGGPVEVRTARSDARSSSARERTDSVVVSIAAPQATLATVAHELAHVLAGPGHGHDAVFRRALLDVVAAITNLGSSAPRGSDLARRGAIHRDQMAGALRAGGLEIGKRTWSAPDVGGPIPL